MEEESTSFMGWCIKISKTNNVDFAKESENFSKESILSLRGNFMLAQTTKSFQDSYKDLLQ